MTPALAIFVKTPGFSPVKTRLAATIGAAQATRFHRLAAAATAAVARSCRPALVPYWAVAEIEPAAHRVWSGFAHVWQGEGGLGERLHHVYSELQARHGRVLLIGADAPQLTPALLGRALAVLNAGDSPFVLGDAADGGFWLFGGREPIDRNAWLSVLYSRPDTAMQLRDALAAHGRLGTLPMLADTDDAADLPVLIQALAALPDLLPAQRTLHAWLLTITDETSLAGVHA